MEEFTVKMASNVGNKKHSVFKLHRDDNVNWNEAKMRRENEYQPWQIKSGGGRTARRFKALKEGGVGDNASYFVFYKPQDKSDTYEICPVDDWFSVSATQRYKTLTAEEAELKFETRHKMLNLFSVMHLKKNGDAGEDGGSRQDTKAFKVSEMDDWDNSGDDEVSGNEDEDPDEAKKKALRKKKISRKEKDEHDGAPDEGKEDSDEGDFEQREVDYMSDSSSESSDPEEDRQGNEVKGIAEEEALRDLLSTDDEEDADNPQQKGFKMDGKNTAGINNSRNYPDGEGSDESSDSDDYDVDDDKMDSMLMKKGLPPQLSVVKQEIKQEAEPSGSRATSKRKSPPEAAFTPPQPFKRPNTSEPPPSAQNSHERTVEDLVKRYLSRRPMTLKTLLKDIKSKLKRMEGAAPEMDSVLVNTIASVINRLKPDKQKINDVTYLSLRS